MSMLCGYCEGQMNYSAWGSWVTEVAFTFCCRGQLLLSWQGGRVMQTEQKLLSLPPVAICSPPRSPAMPDMPQTSLLAAERSMGALPGHFEAFHV